MPEKPCANESIHPAHDWPHVPSYRCPGISRLRRLVEGDSATTRDTAGVARILVLQRTLDERNAQHSAQVRGLMKRIKNLKARVTTADEVLAYSSRTADVSGVRDMELRARLRERAELAEARTVIAQDQLDDALATLEEMRRHLLHMATGKTGRTVEQHSKALIWMIDGREEDRG